MDACGHMPLLYMFHTHLVSVTYKRVCACVCVCVCVCACVCVGGGGGNTRIARQRECRPRRPQRRQHLLLRVSRGAVAPAPTRGAQESRRGCSVPRAQPPPRATAPAPCNAAERKPVVVTVAQWLGGFGSTTQRSQEQQLRAWVYGTSVTKRLQAAAASVGRRHYGSVCHRV